jgi:hypothetical protein
MMPEAFVSHCTPKRLRLKIPSHKGDVSYFSDLKETYSGVQAFESVEVNPLTGSILFVSEAIDLEAIAKRGEGAQLFQLPVTPPGPVPVAEKVVASLRSANQDIHRFTGGDIDLAGIAFLTLIGVGIYQISRGNVGAMPWYTAFWYAFGVFTKSVADKLPGGSKKE